MSKNKIYYTNLVKDHKKILAKTREIIGKLLEKLDDDIQNFNPEDENSKSEMKFWWGDKESASSILARLTQLLLKLIPLELEIARLDLTKVDIAELEEVVERTKIPDEDIEIINRYIERIRDEKTQQ